MLWASLFGLVLRFCPYVYVQPVCPAAGFIWVPGYWAYGPDGYFWVPGTWVEPPEVGLLWTPGYWGWNDGLYVWYPGYWGPEVGFYGGINYGFGYTGVGFYGGYWRGGTYYYNRAVNNVNVTVVHNTYNTTVVNNNTKINRVSFNSGPGGTTVRPTSREMEVARQHHIRMTSEQTQHQQAASSNRTLLASVNHGRPDVAATPRPGEFKGRALETGRPATSNRPPDNRKEENRKEATHPMKPSENSGRTENRGRTFEDRLPSSRSSNAPRLNPTLDQKHQREIEKLHQQQDAERQKVQQQHAQEQQKLQQHKANQQGQEQLQRRQQQQMQQMQQKHDQQNQKLQERQQREAQNQQKTEPKRDRRPPR